jgi:hypothetical protein
MVKSIDQNSMSNNSYPKALVVHDFNKDRKLDIAVANSGSNNIGIFLGRGDGTLSIQTTYPTGTDSQPSSVAVGDFNNDRQLDIVVANFGAHNIGILLGNGDGTFKDQTTFANGSSRPLWVTVGDFNNDSRLDIVIVNYGTNSIGILLGYDNGSFTKQIILSTGFDSIPFSAVVADFNNDDNLDIAVTNHGTYNIIIFLGDGSGTFPIQTTFSTGIGSQPYAIAVADFNNDTKLDIVVANYGTDNVCVLFGYGNGTFIIQGTYSTGNNSKPISVIVGDFDYDNRLDIAVSNSGTNNVEIFLAYANEIYTNQKSFSTGLSSEPYFVASGDFNSDGWLDIAVANYETNAVDILLAYINITFSIQTTYSSGANFEPISVGVGDFNNDSLLDIVVAYYMISNVDLFLGKDGGIFSNPITYSIGNSIYPVAIGVGDFNNDNVLDVVVGCQTFINGLILVFLGNNVGDFTHIITWSNLIFYYASSIAVGDFNNDSLLDIVTINAFSVLGVLLGKGDGTFSHETSYLFQSDLAPQSIAVGDFNSDDRLDIVVANELNSSSLSSNVGIFLGYGNGTFSNQMTFSTGYYALTQSVAVGDFNNDSRLDIVVANSWNSNIGILLGYGDGTFSSQKTHSTGDHSNPVYVTVSDFNNDSRLDVLVVNQDIQTVMIFLGNGNASFPNKLSYSTGNSSHPLSAVLGDFNRDALMDIATVNSGNYNLGVMLAVANLNFSSETTFSTGSSPGPRYVVINDFNNDNRLDIAVANYITNNIGVFLADANGGFPIQMLYSTDSFSLPTSITVADFNKDMQLDIAVANSGTDNIGLFLGYGNGNFESQKTYSIAADSNLQSIAHGDFNNDSKPDIVVANYGNDNINILLNSYGGRFKTEIPYSTGYGSFPHGIAIGDMNNDRILDIVIANNGNGNIGIFLGTGNGTFAGQKTYFMGDYSYPISVAVGDFNNDNRLDIVVVRNVAYEIIIFIQDENGNFSNYGSYYTGDDSWPIMVAVGDFNNDSRLDIAVANFKTSNILIFIGMGNCTFSNLSSYQTGTVYDLNAITIGDFNSDYRLDLATVSAGKDYVSVLLGNSDGTFSEQKTYPINTGSAAVWIAVGDFDMDSHVDIVVADQGTDDVGVLFGYGNGTFENQVTFSTGTGSQPNSVAVGDFNKDGRLDIAVANSQSGNIGVLLGYVNRTFFPQMTFFTDDDSSLPYAVVVGDFNNDKLLDIAVSNGYSENIGIFLALAEDTVLNVPSYSTGLSSQPKYVAVGDFNNDTRLDIAVANYGTNNIMILLGSGYGTISSEIIYSTGTNSQPCWIAIDDLNNDNRLDIVVANSGNDNVGILFGYGNGTFSSQITYSTGVKSQPSSVIIDDFNNDTRLDIAVANHGGNTVGVFFGYGNGSFASQFLFSAGFESRPLALASEDVNQDNMSDIVIANNGYGNIEILLKLC